MKILIAGATGAIGQPLIRLLKGQGHEIFGITQSPERAALIKNQGAHGVVLDVLDREAVFAAFGQVKPDILIDMLTRLPKEYTPQAMQEAGPLDAKIRMEGGANLLAAAIKNQVKRTIVQSCAFWYAPGDGLADENTSFALHATPGIVAGSQMYLEIEQRAFNSPLSAVALRFGFYYGPGTWFNPAGNMAEQVRNQQFPLMGSSTGVWNFVHIEDAAQSIVLALNAPPGIYNIVNDTPTPLAVWLPAFAKAIQALPPLHLSEAEALAQRGADSFYYATQLRGASNAKAKKILGFEPRPFNYNLA